MPLQSKVIGWGINDARLYSYLGYLNLRPSAAAGGVKAASGEHGADFGPHALKDAHQSGGDIETVVSKVVRDNHGY